MGWAGMRGAGTVAPLPPESAHNTQIKPNTPSGRVPRPALANQPAPFALLRTECSGPSGPERNPFVGGLFGRFGVFNPFEGGICPNVSPPPHAGHRHPRVGCSGFERKIEKRNKVAGGGVLGTAQNSGDFFQSKAQHIFHSAPLDVFFYFQGNSSSLFPSKLTKVVGEGGLPTLIRRVGGGVVTPPSPSRIFLT